SRRQMTLNYPRDVRNQMPKYVRPRANLMQNLSHVVVVEQKPVRGNSRSTVGTYMDITTMIRLLFSRIGKHSIDTATDFSSQSSFGNCQECIVDGEVIVPDLHKIEDFENEL